MSTIHVCSLQRLHSTVDRSGASHLITVINEGTPVVRPHTIRPDRHLLLGFHDINLPIEGMTLPAAGHIDRLIKFVRAWDRETPMVVHCFAGISRSTAGAFIAACIAAPDRDEDEVAKLIRQLSPTAHPNPVMVRLADEMLGRNGRMIRAIEAIGPGIQTFDARPFALPLAG